MATPAGTVANGKEPGTWSLVGRLTGGVALIALLSLGAQALVLTLWLRPALHDLIAVATDQALSVQTALQAVPPAQRPALAERLSGGAVTVALRAPPLPPEAAAPPPGWGRGPRPFGLPPPALGDADPRARDEIALRIVPGNAADRAHGGSGSTGDSGDGDPDGADDDGVTLVFRLPVDDQVWWLTRVAGGAAGAVSGTLIVWLLLLGGATVGALLVSVRLIARPLGQLAQQLSLQQGQLRPLPERSDASAELQALVRAFNQLVHQVTAAGQQRQQLLAGVSHDLRTPLARLRLRAETQCEPPLADALAADLHALERIADQFLAYVHSDGMLAPGVAVPLSESVHDAVQPYIADGADVWLQLEPVALAVPDLALQRLLCNLIDNALAYGRPPVQVVLHAAAAGRDAELWVADGGPGMSPDEFARAQQPFVRLTRARSELGHCGLGLAIVSQIARQLGGTLAVRQVRLGAPGRDGVAAAEAAATKAQAQANVTAVTAVTDGSADAAGAATSARFAIVLALPGPGNGAAVTRGDIRSPPPHRPRRGAA